MSLLVSFVSPVWTEVDGGSDLTVTASTITAATMAENAVDYVYYDYGASYWSEDYDFTFRFKYTESTDSQLMYPWALISTTVGATGQRVGVDNVQYLKFTTSGGYGNLYAGCCHGASDTVSTALGSLVQNKEYTIRVVRNEAVGTYGYFYMEVYNDPEMTDLVGRKANIIPSAKDDMRYMVVMSSYGSGGLTDTFSGYITKLCLDANPYSKEAIRTKVRYALNEATASTWSDAELNYIINDVIRDITMYAGCSQNILGASTTASTRYVAYTTTSPDLYGGGKVEVVDYKPSSGSRYALIERDVRSFGRLQTPGTAPMYYADWDEKVWIDPLPDATYDLDIYYVCFQKDETTDVYIPIMHPAFRNLIVPCVTAKALLKIKKYAAARQLWTLAMNELVYLKQLLLDNIPDSVTDLRYQ